MNSIKRAICASIVAVVCAANPGYAAGNKEFEPEMVKLPGLGIKMGKYEITQGQWKAVMGNNPSYFSNCGDNCPVEQVSWNDIQEFLARLNRMTGKQYRLPNEAEWEYACYGGSRTEYCGGDDINSVAWYEDNSGKKTHPAGQKQANGYGLHDMSGNVREWMEDCYDSSCAGRAIRDGSWYNSPGWGAGAANRIGNNPAEGNWGVGFRLALGRASEQVTASGKAQAKKAPQPKQGEAGAIIISNNEKAESERKRKEAEQKAKADAKRAADKARADKLNADAEAKNAKEAADAKASREKTLADIKARKAACAAGDKTQCGSRATQQ